MSLRVGIIGLENVGKSALFQAVTGGTKAAGRSNVATVPVPDSRIQILADMVHPKRLVPAGVEFVDVGGITRTASSGEGLGAQLLSNLQGVDALAIVLRFYDRPDIGFGIEPATPVSDLQAILLELGLSDLGRMERRLERASKAARGGDLSAQHEEQVLLALRGALDEGQLARSVPLSPSDAASVRDLGLLTLKPMIYVANVSEMDLPAATHEKASDPNGVVSKLDEIETQAHTAGATVATISAQLEAELAELPESDAHEYLDSLGVQETGLGRFVHSAYGLLNWLTFFTAGEPEVRAWTVRQGARAPEAAGRIHSDIERGFIRAEVTSWDDLVTAGDPDRAKRAGKTRLEGKDYVMQEGDVVYFRFNV